jgi:anti-sigma B factor antagonist
MLDITQNEKGDIILSGRFDTSQVEEAKSFFASIKESANVNFEKLDYISSAGLGVLLMTQKRLMASQHRLTLTGMNSHIREVFKYAGFDTIFDIE